LLLFCSYGLAAAPVVGRPPCVPSLLAHTFTSPMYKKKTAPSWINLPGVRHRFSLLQVNRWDHQHELAFASPAIVRFHSLGETKRFHVDDAELPVRRTRSRTMIIHGVAASEQSAPNQIQITKFRSSSARKKVHGGTRDIIVNSLLVQLSQAAKMQVRNRLLSQRRKLITGEAAPTKSSTRARTESSTEEHFGNSET
jgi:hypothetical protein